MKAAVLHELGGTPRCEKVPDPVPQNDDQLIVSVQAASIKNIDKGRAKGTHYAAYTELPAVVGFDGVGLLADGTRIYAQGISGMIAEKAIVSKSSYVVIPDNLDLIIAAALPNALLGAVVPLRYRAKMQAGNTILINGATGYTGRMAVQVARHYGAAKIFVTGRNQDSLDQLKDLGADETISLKQDDGAIVSQLKALHSQSPINHVIDYLWGHPTELIIQSFMGSGMNKFTPTVRIVTVGSMAGATIQLSSAVLRSSAIEIVGSGIGSVAQEDLHQFFTVDLTELFQLAADKKLTTEVEVADLTDIEAVWNQRVDPGKRLVVRM